MILYHGSKKKLDILRRFQATNSVLVPEDELFNAIYLSPDFGFAFACAVRPNGVTSIDHDGKTIRFEHPELFDPERIVYVYEVDTDALPKEALKRVDEWQVAVVKLEEIRPTNIHELKAGDITKYYKLLNQQ